MYDIRELTEYEREDFLCLWRDAFGDGPEFYEAMERCFGEDLVSYVLADEEGRIQAGLTQFLMGWIGDAPVYVSYAINTRSSSRGEGYGSAITAYARDVALRSGGISMLSPAEPDLIDFYRSLDYRDDFYAVEGKFVVRDTLDQIDIIRLEKLSADDYQLKREKILKDTTHVELSAKTLQWIASNSSGMYYLEVASALGCADDEVDADGHAGQVRVSGIIVDDCDEGFYLTEILADTVDDRGEGFDFAYEDAVNLLVRGYLKAVAPTKTGVESSLVFYRSAVPKTTQQTGKNASIHVQAMIAGDRSDNHQAERGSRETFKPYFGFPFD